MIKIGLMNSLLRDPRHGLRALAKSPGFALAGVLTLASGIGANTAIFIAADAVILHPLPYPHAGRLLDFSPAAFHHVLQPSLHNFKLAVLNPGVLAFSAAAAIAGGEPVGRRYQLS